MPSTRLGFLVQSARRRVWAVITRRGVSELACDDVTVVADRVLTGSGTQALKALVGKEYIIAARKRWL